MDISTQDVPVDTTADNKRVIAIVCYAAIIASMALISPAVAVQIVKEWQVTPAQLGLSFALEPGTVIITTLASFWWLSRINWRLVMTVSTLGFIVTNILSGFAPSWEIFLTIRVLTAAFGGTMMILTVTSSAVTSNVEKTYSYWVLGQLVLAAIGLIVLPYIFAPFGLAGLYCILAIMAALCMPLIKYFPTKAKSQTISSTTSKKTFNITPLTVIMVITALAAVLCFYTGLSGLWVFVGQISENAKIPNTNIILSIGTVLGIVGSALAGLFKKESEAMVLAIGYILMAASVLLFFGVPGLIRFSIAVFIFKFAWTFLLPWMLSSISYKDDSGRLMSAVNFFMGGGFAVGPYLAGRIVQSNQQDFTVLLFTSCGFILFSMVCLFICRAIKVQN